MYLIILSYPKQSWFAQVTNKCLYTDSQNKLKQAFLLTSLLQCAGPAIVAISADCVYPACLSGLQHSFQKILCEENVARWQRINMDKCC